MDQHQSDDTQPANDSHHATDGLLPGDQHLCEESPSLPSTALSAAGSSHAATSPQPVNPLPPTSTVKRSQRDVLTKESLGKRSMLGTKVRAIPHPDVNRKVQEETLPFGDFGATDDKQDPDLGSASVISQAEITQEQSRNPSLPGEQTQEQSRNPSLPGEQTQEQSRNAPLPGEQTQENSELLTVTSLIIVGGNNSYGETENIAIRIALGEVISVVGLGGSGKKVLLDDIETLAAMSTPSNRNIVINGSRDEVVAALRDQDKAFKDQQQKQLLATDVTLPADVSSIIINRLTKTKVAQPNRSIRNYIEAFCIATNRPLQTANIGAILARVQQLTGNTIDEETGLQQLTGNTIDETTGLQQLSGNTIDEATGLQELSEQTMYALYLVCTALLGRAPIVLIDRIDTWGLNVTQSSWLIAQQQKMVIVTAKEPWDGIDKATTVIMKHGGIANVIVP